MKIVDIRGASTARGWHDHVLGGWAQRIQMEMSAHNEERPDRPVVVDNHAMPGLTLAGIVRTLKSELVRYTYAGYNVSSVLSVGFNESKIMPGNRVPIVHVDRFAGLLGQFSQIVEELGVRTVFVGPQPLLDEMSVNPLSGCVVERDLLEEYNGVMAEEAARAGMPFVDAFSLFAPNNAYDNLPNLLAADRRHPNAHGHALLHSVISRALRSIDGL